MLTLRTYFQSIHQLHHNQKTTTFGYEALLRGFKNGVMVPPEEVFSIAASLNRDVDLDLMAFELSCKTFMANNVEGSLFINLLPQSILSSKFSPPAIAEFFSSIGLNPSRVVIELVEGKRMTAFDELSKKIAPLMETGIRFALDDFGSGAGDMERWIKLTPNILKLDRVLIDGVAHDLKRQQAVLAMEAMVIGTETILLCEGLTYGEDVEWLSENTGIPLFQGFYFSLPVPAFSGIDITERFYVDHPHNGLRPQPEDDTIYAIGRVS